MDRKTVSGNDGQETSSKSIMELSFLDRMVILLCDEFHEKTFEKVTVPDFLIAKMTVFKEIRDLLVTVLGTAFAQKKSKINRVYLFDNNSQHMILKDGIDCRFPIANHVVKYGLKGNSKKQDIYVTWLLKRNIPLPNAFARSLLQVYFSHKKYIYIYIYICKNLIGLNESKEEESDTQKEILQIESFAMEYKKIEMPHLLTPIDTKEETSETFAEAKSPIMDNKFDWDTKKKDLRAKKANENQNFEFVKQSPIGIDFEIPTHSAKSFASVKSPVIGVDFDIDTHHDKALKDAMFESSKVSHSVDIDFEALHCICTTRNQWESQFTREQNEVDLERLQLFIHSCRDWTPQEAKTALSQDETPQNFDLFLRATKRSPFPIANDTFVSPLPPPRNKLQRSVSEGYYSGLFVVKEKKKKLVTFVIVCGYVQMSFCFKTDSWKNKHIQGRYNMNTSLMENVEFNSAMNLQRYISPTYSDLREDIGRERPQLEPDSERPPLTNNNNDDGANKKKEKGGRHRRGSSLKDLGRKLSQVLASPFGKRDTQNVNGTAEGDLFEVSHTDTIVEHITDYKQEEEELTQKKKELQERKDRYEKHWKKLNGIDENKYNYVGEEVEERGLQLLEERKKLIRDAQGDIHESLSKLEESNKQVKNHIRETYQNIMDVIKEQEQSAIQDVEEYTETTKTQLLQMYKDVMELEQSVFEHQVKAKQALYIARKGFNNKKTQKTRKKFKDIVKRGLHDSQIDVSFYLSICMFFLLF
ncbi:hypothetical protein RFI_28353 [Reticulomyxa filosa]|uniref:Uncharacterized protein n=1 Tax=Reticulomyxa filosa TaxID=46433 RepID=X6M7M3_RETFI|nr:hypothetical protein RFI_28353 [Reticulomyxa filosa]|eukprot:ETO09035.1 hypothetical protein RFI_28353 [Reticulomyxa filosa]